MNPLKFVVARIGLRILVTDIDPAVFVSFFSKYKTMFLLVLSSLSKHLKISSSIILQLHWLSPGADLLNGHIFEYGSVKGVVFNISKLRLVHHNRGWRMSTSSADQIPPPWPLWWPATPQTPPPPARTTATLPEHQNTQQNTRNWKAPLLLLLDY